MRSKVEGATPPTPAIDGQITAQRYYFLRLREVEMRVVSAAVMGAFVLLGCNGNAANGGNRLLGTWQLVPGGSCMIDRMTFTPENLTSHNGRQSYYAGQERTIPVTYRFDGPDRVVVTTRDMATSETYILTDDNHLHMGSRPSCSFQRGA